MRQVRGAKVFSASDLVNFVECRHLTSLDLVNLDTPLPRSADDEELLLLAGKGSAHEAAYLQQLRASVETVCEIARGLSDDAAHEATLEAMRRGDDVIYQATLRRPGLIGRADFLRKVAALSPLGPHSYEVVDTKLARSPRAKFLIQLSFYSDLLASIQERPPSMTHVVLGNGTEVNYRVADYAHYYERVKRAFLAHLDARPETYPEPCERCDICHWRGLCEEKRAKDDHLVQVADIRKLQIKRLRSAGLHTLEALAEAPEAFAVPKMVPETFDKLREQAALQYEHRRTGERAYRLLETAGVPGKGFLRLPTPSEGDIYFDIEGDPLEEGGLEYLLGALYLEKGKPVFRAFWAHSRSEERRSFEQFMDFVAARMAEYPDLHIYHYASYENTALKKLMSVHGTREAQVDDLLRRGTLVDLYKVVREALRVSEPGYSLKNIEAFYMAERADEVKTAGTSIVYYEKWKEISDPSLLERIGQYNERDCLSLLELRKWLDGLAPGAPAPTASRPGEEERQPSERTRSTEAMLERYRGLLLRGLPEDRTAWGQEEHLRELSYLLLDFHRRAAKPAWWEMFARMDQTEEELIEDPECIAGIRLIEPPVHDKRSFLHTYSYPEQEFKLRAGNGCLNTETLKSAGTIYAIDEVRRIVQLRRLAKLGPLPERLSVGPTQPVNTDKLTAAIERFAQSVAEGTNRYAAIKAYLVRALPQAHGHAAGAPLIDEADDPVKQAIEVVDRLEGSYLFIQGPPGAGKTYTGSRIIAELLHRGKRVGISSNSHKAINNMLSAVVTAVKESGFSFRGIKKSNSAIPETEFGGEMVENCGDADEAIEQKPQLLAGTAWLFAEPELDGQLDYIFVDEAGQVSLANLVAMGTSAKNVVLLGDQMQLSQPIQGVHPGRSGDSALDYLLDGTATVRPEHGIFLKKSWRMHSDVCRFISDAVYEGRLEPEADNARQRLILSPGAHPALRPTGISFLDADHDGCAQRSEEEAVTVKALYDSLLQQSYVDRNGTTKPMTMANILVVAPYNMQVNLLRRTLPEGARVGTVDKFQGQEAEAVIVSMTTSSEDYMPRYMEFLFSKNRLNVAISRARCLSIVVASQRLLDVTCRTPEQMALANLLCWVRDYGGSA